MRAHSNSRGSSAVGTTASQRSSNHGSRPISRYNPQAKSVQNLPRPVNKEGGSRQSMRDANLIKVHDQNPQLNEEEDENYE